MAKIRCFYEDCLFLKKGHCASPIVQFDPDDGCLTYQIKELKEEENDELLELITGDDEELEDLYEDDDSLYNEWDDEDDDEVY